MHFMRLLFWRCMVAGVKTVITFEDNIRDDGIPRFVVDYQILYQAALLGGGSETVVAVDVQSVDARDLEVHTIQGVAAE